MEGVFGLRRSLQDAGAHEILMSLWPVPDNETQELMQQFFTRWLQGVQMHEALRQAQLVIRARGEERTRRSRSALPLGHSFQPENDSNRRSMMSKSKLRNGWTQ